MRTKVNVRNLKCSGCKATIIHNLAPLKNIYDVVVDLDDKMVSFEYNTHHDFEKAKHILSSIGYPVTGLEFN
jgi:copper chaperone CopZ